MIVFEGAVIAGRRGRPLLGPLTAEFAEGVTALVGPPDDGGALYLEVLAGASKLRGGRVSVFGEPAQSRPDVAWVPLATDLPGSQTTSEMLALGAMFRGGPVDTPLKRLDRFGMASIALRRIESLDATARHTASLVEALTSSARVLLLEEPLCRVDARAIATVIETIRARAKTAPVIIATASERDARALGARVWTVRGGTSWAPRSPQGDVDQQPRAVRVMGADLRPLAAALAKDARAATLTWQGSALVVAGADSAAAESIAAAVGEAIATAGVSVDLVEPLTIDATARSTTKTVSP